MNPFAFEIELFSHPIPAGVACMLVGFALLCKTMEIMELRALRRTHRNRPYIGR